MEKKRLVIIDCNSIIYRAFHALPPLTTKKGDLVNALYGFLLFFFKVIREFQPDYVVACFDSPRPTFRHEKYREYKITRPPTPKELSQQIPKVKEVLRIFNVPIFEKEGFEADDLIGTISKKLVSPLLEKIVLSGDLDTLQLVDKETKVFLLKKGLKETILYDENLVKEKYLGLIPEKIVDFKALKGDPSDNIPGVTGIGEKTAIDLIKKFGSLENLYQHLDQIKPKLKEMLIQQKKQAFLSKILAEIRKDLAIELNLKKCQWGRYDLKEITQFLRKMEFQTLIKRLPELKKSKNSQLSINF